MTRRATMYQVAIVIGTRLLTVNTPSRETAVFLKLLIRGPGLRVRVWAKADTWKLLTPATLAP